MSIMGSETGFACMSPGNNQKLRLCTGLVNRPYQHDLRSLPHPPPAATLQWQYSPCTIILISNYTCGVKEDLSGTLAISREKVTESGAAGEKRILDLWPGRQVSIRTDAYERRFPTCKLIPVVLACDITSDTTSADGAVRVTERRCKLNVDAPFLIKKVP
ncbi:hypothetical protein J6590_064641 [Homalodisca vitripennis]|nr:hypothetical protein J6590_064641 [Homalodisca vitripennis]